MYEVYTCRQYRLLIAGSRQANAELLSNARQAAERARANGWLVLVGDAADLEEAVMAACNALRVNYLCFGVSLRPRSQQFCDAMLGGTGRYFRVDSSKGYSYPLRDRYMADLADRGLFLLDGSADGIPAVYAYMQSLSKPVEVLGVTSHAQPPAETALRHHTPKARPATPAVVEVIVMVTPAAGTFGLRALDNQGALLYQTRHVLTNLSAATPDAATLTALVQALDLLESRLKGDAAPYALRIVQSSRNVEGWLLRGWKRPAHAAQDSARRAASLLKRFPDTEWIRMPPAQVASLLAKIV